MKAFLRYWSPLLAWMVFIFIGSTDVMSAEHTSRIIGPVLRWLDPGISPLTAMNIELLVRKMGHVSEYAVLSALLFRALVHTVLKGRVALAAAVVLFCCALYAASDEFHQSFVPSRTASARDVLIDISGATLAVAFYALFARSALVRARPASVQSSNPG